MTLSETRPSHTSLHSIILCYGYELLFMLKILGTIKRAQAPFLFFFSCSSTNAQIHTITHRHRHAHTHARANTGTTFTPCDLARHYANGQTCHLPEISLRLREKEWARDREKWERFCTFASLCELLVKCKYSAYTGRMKFSCYSYLQSMAVWGLSILRKIDTWSLRSNVELFWGTCHVYCSLSKFLEGFLKST